LHHLHPAAAAELLWRPPPLRAHCHRGRCAHDHGPTHSLRGV
ncbi:hypothetical protein HaLaN_31728, partial [Haematococcus lacustris]